MGFWTLPSNLFTLRPATGMDPVYVLQDTEVNKMLTKVQLYACRSKYHTLQTTEDW